MIGHTPFFFFKIVCNKKVSLEFVLQTLHLFKMTNDIRRSCMARVNGEIRAVVLNLFNSISPLV